MIPRGPFQPRPFCDSVFFAVVVFGLAARKQLSEWNRASLR